MRCTGGYFTGSLHNFFERRVVGFQREALGDEVNGGGGYAGQLADGCFHAIRAGGAIQFG